MHNSQNKKTLQIVLIVLVAVITLGIGYASISSINLIVNGDATANPNDNNFKVKFLNEEGITPIIEGAPTNTVQVDSDTTASFNVVTLNAVGQSVTATYKIKNESNNVGAIILLSVTNSNSEYFKVTETINDNKLQAGEETTATVKVEMIKTPINNAVTTSITATLSATPLENDSATGGSPASKVAGDPESFSTDSWATIKKAVQNNNTSVYNVGDTKSVTINGNNYRVRIANKSTAQNCSDTNYSETACGFVVEFVDILTIMKMKNTQTNIGGYPQTLVYDYLNNTLLEELPSDLQAAIKPTRVISGYGDNGTDSENFISTNQKLYLLSGVEVQGTDTHDIAENTTTQLEFYKNSSNSKIKQYNGSDLWWWLRTAGYYNYYAFRVVYANGIIGDLNAINDTGIAPAFRIG